MKKKLLIIIPIVLVICVIVGVVIYFALQAASKKVTELQDQLTVSPTIETSLNENSETNTDTEEGTTTTNVVNDVCKVLTLDIAKQLLGEDTKLGSQNEGNCTYTTTSESLASFGVLTMVVTKSNAVTAKAQFEQAKTSTYSNKTEDVTGLNADGAYFADTFKQLSILKGDSWIIISGTSDKFDTEKDLAVATAKLVLK